MYHSFCVEIANQCGLNEAIILENIHFWIKKNIANGQNYFDGNYWTYNSMDAFSEMFPYMGNRKTISRLLSKLEEQGFIATGCYNKVAYDRTKWYALTEKGFSLFGDDIPEAPEMDAPMGQNVSLEEDKMSDCIGQKLPFEWQKMTNRMARNDQPIPDINTDINTDIKNNSVLSESAKRSTAQKSTYSKEFESFWSVYPRRKEKAMTYKNWNARLNDGYSPDEMITAAKAYASQCQKNRTEERFIKLAKTFLGPNMPFTDFLPRMSEPAKAVGGEPDFSRYV